MPTFLFVSIFSTSHLEEKKKTTKRLDGKWIAIPMWSRFSNVLNYSKTFHHITIEKTTTIIAHIKALLKPFMHIEVSGLCKSSKLNSFL